MPDRKVIILYISLMACYIAHVIEEMLGDFIVIQFLGSIYIFLLINAILLLVLLAVLYYLRQGNRRAVLIAILFSVIMIGNGILHNLAFLITGRYYNGFAGAFTGIALILMGVPLFINLYKYYKSRYSQKTLELP